MSGEPVRLKCLSCSGVFTVTDWSPTVSSTILRFDCGGCRKPRRFGTLVEVLTKGAAIDELEAKPVGYAPGDYADPIAPIRVGENLVDADTGEIVGPAAPPGRFEAGMAASEAASRKWTVVEVDRVDQAIRTCAAVQSSFTADDVWRALGPAFPVTKGLAARLNAAVRAGLIESTGFVQTSQREGEHGHAQRLTIWRPKT